MLGSGLAGAQAGDAQDGDGVGDLRLGQLLGGLGPLVDGPDCGAFQQEDLCGVGEADVGGGVQDPDGPLLPPPVTGVDRCMGDGHTVPVQGVDAVVQPPGVLLDRHHVVRVQVLDNEDRVRADGMPGIGGDHPTGQVLDLGQVAQQGLELGDLVALGAYGSFGDHDGVGVGGRGQQVRDRPVHRDRASDRLTVDRQARAQDRCTGPRVQTGANGRDRAGRQVTGQQVRPDLVGQPLGRQRREHPLDSVRVRCDMPAETVAAQAHRGQQVLRCRRDPGCDPDQVDLTGQHRGRAQPQDRGQGMSSSTRVPRVGHRGETRQQTGPGPFPDASRDGDQRRDHLDHLTARHPLEGHPARPGGPIAGSRQDGNDRLNRQRSPSAERMI